MRGTRGANHRPTKLLPASVECLTAGSYERERGEFRLGSGYRASSASDSPVSAVPSPFMRSAPIRLHRRDDTGTQRKPCCVARLIHRQVNLPRPINARKSAVQPLIPLASGIVVSSASDSPVSAVPSPFMRSRPIRLQRRDDTGTQRKPCFVALLISRSGGNMLQKI